MNRVIKFRAWDETRSQMIYDFGIIAEDQPQLMTTEDNELYCYHYAPNQDYTEPVLMQFTGLKDKNGKNIYEGDILRDLEGNEAVVSFYGGAFMVSDWADSVSEVRYETIVIGNIYENPELL